MTEEQWVLRKVAQLKNDAIEVVVAQVMNKPDTYVLHAIQGLKKITIGCDGQNMLTFANAIVKGVAQN